MPISKGADVKKCHICTDCGACLAGHVHGMDVVTDREATAPIPFVYAEHRKGKRLVTTDVGTTTIAMQLYGTDGAVEEQFVCVNPQVRYGADVLSRIQAAKDDETAKDMRNMVREKLAEGLALFARCLRDGETLTVVLAGNTTMIYLLMGYPPAELGQAPFAASHLELMETELSGVPCLIFPGLSAFVGGDIVAGMYACDMWEKQELTLLIDLGTNGEMVLGNRQRRVACATAAGPAFEGGVNRGVWGSDMVSLLARLKKEGIVDETGLLADEFFEEGILIGNVRVTQEAIRAIQLAKGAIGAGICILMQEYGLYAGKIDRVVLAGGFGYYLNPEDAACIGLLPQELVGKTRAGGNTALAGALLLGRELLKGGDAASWLAGRETEVLNLAKHPDFERLYLEHLELKET